MSTTTEAVARTKAAHDLYTEGRDWAEAIARKATIACIVKKPNGATDHVGHAALMRRMVEALGSERFHRLESDARLAVLESCECVREQIEEQLYAKIEVIDDCAVLPDTACRVEVARGSPVLTNYEIEIEGYEDILMRCLLVKQGYGRAVYDCTNLHEAG